MRVKVSMIVWEEEESDGVLIRERVKGRNVIYVKGSVLMSLDSNLLKAINVPNNCEIPSEIA